MRPAILGASIILVLFGVVNAQARTWRVNTMGTGDAPTLYAAMDSATAGDEVLVEAGEYPLAETLYVPEQVHLTGESGPAHTILYRTGLFPISTLYLRAGSKVTGVQVRGYAQALVSIQGGGIVIQECIINPDPDNSPVGGSYQPTLYNCLITGGVVHVVATYVSCILMSKLQSDAVGSQLFFCDVLGSVDPAIDASASNLNFSLDPEFCGVEGSGNYFLRSTSPCLGENNPFGPGIGLVGPLPMGCGAVKTETRTWGGVKALYR